MTFKAVYIRDCPQVRRRVVATPDPEAVWSPMVGDFITATSGYIYTCSTAGTKVSTQLISVAASGAGFPLTLTSGTSVWDRSSEASTTRGSSWEDPDDTMRLLYRYSGDRVVFYVDFTARRAAGEFAYAGSVLYTQYVIVYTIPSGVVPSVMSAYKEVPNESWISPTAAHPYAVSYCGSFMTSEYFPRRALVELEKLQQSGRTITFGAVHNATVEVAYTGDITYVSGWGATLKPMFIGAGGLMAMESYGIASTYEMGAMTMNTSMVNMQGYGARMNCAASTPPTSFAITTNTTIGRFSRRPVNVFYSGTNESNQFMKAQQHGHACVLAENPSVYRVGAAPAGERQLALVCSMYYLHPPGELPMTPWFATQTDLTGARTLRVYFVSSRGGLDNTDIWIDALHNKVAGSAHTCTSGYVDNSFLEYGAHSTANTVIPADTSTWVGVTYSPYYTYRLELPITIGAACNILFSITMSGQAGVASSPIIFCPYVEII